MLSLQPSAATCIKSLACQRKVTLCYEVGLRTVYGSYPIRCWATKASALKRVVYTVWTGVISSSFQSTLFTMTLFVPKYFDVKLNFCCKEFKFKLNWYICANTIDVLKNFAVIKNVTIKSFHWYGFIMWMWKCSSWSAGFITSQLIRIYTVWKKRANNFGKVTHTICLLDHICHFLKNYL